MKRTLGRELKVPEIAEREADGTRLLGKIAEPVSSTSAGQRKQPAGVLCLLARYFLLNRSTSSQNSGHLLGDGNLLAGK